MAGRVAASGAVLVVQERPDDLLLHAFFLVTNLGKFDWPPEKVLALYRKRGSAEAHMGEVKSALDVHLSSTVQAAVIAARRSGRSLSDAVVVSQERQLSAVSFGSPFSSVGHHLSAAAPR